MDSYQLLGVHRGCARAELKEAFRIKALLVHPDRGGDAAEFVRLRQAYDHIIGDIARRPPGLDPEPAHPRPRVEPNWKHADPERVPEFPARAKPLSRIRPARPPDPDWEPEMVVLDEPLPRIRPARPPDPDWEPEFVLLDDDENHESPPELDDTRTIRRSYIKWVRGLVEHSAKDDEDTFTLTIYELVFGVGAVFAMLLLICVIVGTAGSRKPSANAHLDSLLPLPKVSDEFWLHDGQNPVRVGPAPTAPGAESPVRPPAPHRGTRPDGR